MSTLVVLNPGAGGCGDPEARRKELGRISAAEIHVSESAEDGRAAVRRAVEEGYDRIVAAGGDGTIHGLLNALAPDFDRVTFGVVPLGTANDLVRSLELPMDADEAIDAIRSGRTEELDLIELRARDRDAGSTVYCANAATGGFAGAVEEEMEEGTKERWGPLSYVRVAAEQLGETRRWRVELEVDPAEGGGERIGPVELLNVVVANGRLVGGGVPIAPEADPTDGLLDVVSIRSMPPGELALLGPRLLTGDHLSDESVEHRRARSVRVRSDPPMPYSLDGELATFGDVELRVLAGALTTLVGPPADEDDDG